MDITQIWDLSLLALLDVVLFTLCFAHGLIVDIEFADLILTSQVEERVLTALNDDVCRHHSETLNFVDWFELAIRLVG